MQLIHRTPMNLRRVRMAISTNDLGVQLDRHRSSICKAIKRGEGELYEAIERIIVKAETRLLQPRTIKARRHRLLLTQAQCAALCGMPVGTWKDVECRPEQVPLALDRASEVLGQLEALRNMPAKRKAGSPINVSKPVARLPQLVLEPLP